MFKSAIRLCSNPIKKGKIKEGIFIFFYALKEKNHTKNWLFGKLKLGPHRPRSARMQDLASLTPELLTVE